MNKEEKAEALVFLTLNSEKNCFKCFKEYENKKDKVFCNFCNELHCKECIISDKKELK